MKVLPPVTPTPEQMQVLQHRYRTGVFIIRGAAGSGKTTTALLRIRHLLVNWTRALDREGRIPNVLVLTFNRTLRGYIRELARSQVDGAAQITIDTFGHWASSRLGAPEIVDDSIRRRKLRELAATTNLPHDGDFIVNEVGYVLGRLRPDNLDEYPTPEFRRDGRGQTPRITRAQRQVLLGEVIRPYLHWKAARGFLDWNDLATRLAETPAGEPYDIVVVDETQDFTANQVRAVMAALSARYSATFVLDAAQRIYPNFFTWREVDIDANPVSNLCTLTRNYRNTAEIAGFARPLVEGLHLGPDASIPDLTSCSRHGETPLLLRGRYQSQIQWALRYIADEVNLTEESVAFLHPRGGGWFDFLRNQLQSADLSWEELTRSRDWPDGTTNIGLSTLHSAKGLEFDHVMILGLNDEVFNHGDEEGDDALETGRRLLAMAVTRARKSVVLGFKPSDPSHLISFLDADTYTLVDV